MKAYLTTNHLNILNFSVENPSFCDFILTIIVIGFAVLGMSIGIIFNNKPLQGSCGGDVESCICLKGGECDDPSQKPSPTN